MLGRGLATSVTRQSSAGVIAQDQVSRAYGTSSVIDYFGTPTNRAPVNLPSAPTRGA